MEKMKILVGVFALCLLFSFNLRHALNDYGVSDPNNELHPQVYAQTNTAGNGGGSTPGGGEISNPGGGTPPGGDISNPSDGVWRENRIREDKDCVWTFQVRAGTRVTLTVLGVSINLTAGADGFARHTAEFARVHCETGGNADCKATNCPPGFWGSIIPVI